MLSPQTPPSESGYENVAVCRTDDASWTLKDWSELTTLDLDSTHLVGADELLVPTDAGRHPPAEWKKTGEGVDGIAHYRRGGSASASGGDVTPPSGVAVQAAVRDDRSFAPNAVFCSQGLRPPVREAIGPFKVAPAYQGLGDGPRPPSTMRKMFARGRPVAGRRIAVGVIDTGLGQGRFLSRTLEPFVVARCLVSADDEDHPDLDRDERLDPVAGHGNVVTGLIAEAEPQVLIQMVRAVDRQGAVSDLGLAKAIDRLCELQGGAPDILNLSLGGWAYEDREPPAVAARLRELHGQGTAIVAAAGNLKSERVFWPAGMPEVIGVGAVTRNGTAWVPTRYSNRGRWIKAALEADKVVGAFYENFTSKTDPKNACSPTMKFEGSVEWEGTSFLAPQVAGHIARVMIRKNLSPQAAWRRLAGSVTEPSPREMPNAVVFTRHMLST